MHMPRQDMCWCCQVFPWQFWVGQRGMCRHCVDWCTHDDICVTRTGYEAAKGDQPLLYTKTWQKNSQV